MRIPRRRRRLRRLITPAREPVAGQVAVRRWAEHTVDTATGKATALAAAGAGLATVPFGPVAAGLAAGYTAWAVRAWHRHRRARAVQRDREHAAHRVHLLAADLRAGAATAADLTSAAGALPTTDPQCRGIRERLLAVAGLAERVGMPSADLLDRLVHDLRSRGRVTALVRGQTAGVLASARMLAWLPVAGLLLGEAMGADPLSFLLHTVAGAGCAGVAAALQALGMMWARRLAGVDEGTAP